eukprot:1162070-Pelagomonas_calceolata.AAC.5
MVQERCKVTMIPFALKPGTLPSQEQHVKPGRASLTPAACAPCILLGALRLPVPEACPDTEGPGHRGGLGKAASGVGNAATGPISTAKVWTQMRCVLHAACRPPAHSGSGQPA